MMFFPFVVLSLEEEQLHENPPCSEEEEQGEEFTEEIAVMAETEASGSQGWGSSLSFPSSEDVARAVAAAATAVSSPRPSVVFSSNDSGSNSPLKRIQNQDHRSFIEPSKLFESMVVVGLPPSFDAQSLRKRLLARKTEGSGKFRIALSGHNHSRVEPNFEPQVLFVYPPEKQLPLKYRDLLSFCFPGGVEVHAVEKSSSMSELNEILLGQSILFYPLLKLSAICGGSGTHIFRLIALVGTWISKKAVKGNRRDKKRIMGFYGNRRLIKRGYMKKASRGVGRKGYGACLPAREQRKRLAKLSRENGGGKWLPDGECAVLYLLGDGELLERKELARRELDNCNVWSYGIVIIRGYFGGLLKEKRKRWELLLYKAWCIFMEERLERLTKSIGVLDLEVPDTIKPMEGLEENGRMSTQHVSEDEANETVGTPQSSSSGTTASTRVTDVGSPLGNLANSDLEGISSFRDDSHDTDDSLTTTTFERDTLASDKEPAVTMQNSEANDVDFDNSSMSKPTMEKSAPGAVWPLLRYPQFESSEPSCSLGSPSEERQLRSENDETDIKETSISGQEDFSSHIDILEWAKANNHGSLQIICEYYKVDFPPRGTSITFHPLDYLHPLEFHRPSERALEVCGSPLDLGSCRTSLERIEVLNALIAEEEAISLSVVTISCICGYLRLENVLPNDMLEFLDAPVPYIVGVQSKSSEVLSKLPNAMLVDISKNQVKSQSMPQLPQQRELLASLAPYHAKLVGESYLGKRRPIYEYTDVQAEAAKEFMDVLKNYLDSLCSNLRSHTITNVQSNDDKVSLLLKESFIDSFPNRDRAFMKLFIDTQMFSVHTDLVLSFYQKE
uniref:cDENN domain-containing protein n=1 Tax=Chenopodium quinoa TaxID=63459 RepID=A0A803MG80_CHEQI